MKATEPGHVTAAMPGNVVDVLVKLGDDVSAGQAVMVTEAMKMESEINTNVAGKVLEINVAKGDRVTPGEVLMEIGRALARSSLKTFQTSHEIRLRKSPLIERAFSETGFAQRVSYLVKALPAQLRELGPRPQTHYRPHPQQRLRQLFPTYAVRPIKRLDETHDYVLINRPDSTPLRHPTWLVGLDSESMA